MRRLILLYGSSVGKKFIMAATGLMLLGFVLAHMLGNLKVYQGPEKFGAYAEFLREFGAPIFKHGQLLWIARLILLAAVISHIVVATQLTVMSQRAREVGYHALKRLSLSYASHTMRWGGVVIGFFVIYHLLHLTWGSAHHDFVPGGVYHNVVSGFRRWPVSLAYVAAMIPLGLHIYHGLWSAFQTFGLNHPKYNRWRRPLAGGVALVIVVGNISIPAAVLAGWVS